MDSGLCPTNCHQQARETIKPITMAHQIPNTGANAKVFNARPNPIPRNTDVVMGARDSPEKRASRPAESTILETQRPVNTHVVDAQTMASIERKTADSNNETESRLSDVVSP